MKLVFDAKHLAAIAGALAGLAVAFQWLPQQQADAITGLIVVLAGAFVGTPKQDSNP